MTLSSYVKSSRCFHVFCILENHRIEITTSDGYYESTLNLKVGRVLQVLTGILLGNECYEYLVGKFSGTPTVTLHNAKGEAGSLAAQDTTRENINLPSDPANPLPGVYPREMKTLLHKSLCQSS